MGKSLLSKNLCYLRKSCNLSQNDMAAFLNIPRSTYAYIENSSKILKMVLPLRNVVYNKFGYTLDELLICDISVNKEESNTRSISKEVVCKLEKVSEMLFEIQNEIENIKNL